MSIIIALLAAQAAAPAAPAPAPGAVQPAATAGGVQARFDQANRLYEARQCTEALALYDSVGTAPAIQRSGVARAAIALRKGVCLLQVGRADESAALIEAALPTLAAQGDAFANDRRDGHVALGRRLMGRFDYDGAEREFERALALSQGTGRFQPLSHLAQVTAFDGGDKPLAYAAETVALADQIAGLDPKVRGLVAAQHARTLLNQGRLEEANKELVALLAAAGGLGRTVNLDDLVIRSDLALSALLRKDAEGARKYLAYTGQGRLRTNVKFTSGTSMAPPPCDAANGLRPDNGAVIEFQLGEDGAVRGVNPIYVQGGRRTALAFARAVSQWSWSPEVAIAIPLLFRATIRVQVSCSNAADQPGSTMPLLEAARLWLAEQGMPALIATQPERQLLTQLWSLEDSDVPVDRVRHREAVRALIAAAEGKPALHAGALLLLADSPAFLAADRLAAAQQASKLTQPGGVAPVLRALAALKVTFLSNTQRGTNDLTLLRTTLAQPEIAGDALASATLRLVIAQEQSTSGKEARKLVAAIVAEPALPPQHPLKVQALLQQATQYAEAGDLAGAAAAYAATGLTDEQCATLGVKPALKTDGNASAKFPDAALRWGFEGWVRLETDIAPNGKPIAPRAVVAYPPFVFENSAALIMRDVRYRASFRPESAGAACTARSENINFRIP